MIEKDILTILSTFSLPAYKEIPDVGLYLDQVVKYINGYFTSFEEMKITSSMISNYVKQKLITNPHKKTYSREQIANLIFIATAKTVLSIDHIRMCMSKFKDVATDEEIYNMFTEALGRTLNSFSQTSISETQREDMPSEVNAIENIVITVAHKMYLERYFDELKKAEQKSE